MSLVFSGVNEDLLSGTILPTEASQLPTAANLFLISMSYPQDIEWIVGAITEQPTVYTDSYFSGGGSNISGPYVGYDGPPIEEMPPLDIDLGTATLTLEQVPEPATGALAGGVLALGTSIIIRRRR